MRCVGQILQFCCLNTRQTILLGAACILHSAQGGAEVPPPPPPPESRICFTQDECGHALNALLDLVPLTVCLTQDETLPLTIKIEEDMEEAGFLLQQEENQRRHATTACELQKALTGLTMAMELDPGLTNNVVRKIAHLSSRLEQTSKDRESNERRRGENAASARERKCTGIKRGLEARALGE
jgi:hypothetical protein